MWKFYCDFFVLSGRGGANRKDHLHSTIFFFFNPISLGYIAPCFQLDTQFAQLFVSVKFLFDPYSDDLFAIGAADRDVGSSSLLATVFIICAVDDLMGLCFVVNSRLVSQPGFDNGPFLFLFIAE